ncbi:hypothetical protein M011DRAFT_478674 [Sporormia fimetaria CBS 119925]|uniref:Uncharacterized protein n=1 Tax=Sporormia fimetaria CBS 119925 TaxID=1340428 RepID=A0A6A6V5P5_9PLEO|nr:hypothetical protein M011DRAFT_478674 [Sporormia fimetaria CBS 119925]
MLYQQSQSYRFRFALAIFCLTTIILIFSSVYAQQLLKAPTEADAFSFVFSPEEAIASGLAAKGPSRNVIVPMYAAPPLLTLVWTSIDVALYWIAPHWKPIAYGVISTSVIILGWIVTTVFWTQCHVGNNGMEPMWTSELCAILLAM